jgi:hypothetical protein
MRNAQKVLVGKSEGKRSLRRPKRRWEYIGRADIRKNVRKIWNRFTISG